MSFREEDRLQLSGLQHFAFCRRQWALIHVEQQWRDNLRTVEGNILHERAHDDTIRERGRDKITFRGLRITSAKLGISGACDVVEFVRSTEGTRLAGEEGLWQPFPVEYKRGSSKLSDADRLQQGPFQRAEFFWEFGVCPFQKESGPPVDYILTRKKEAEARLKIMVL